MAEFKTDIEIARAANKLQIQQIGAKLGIPQEHLLPYGHDKAKVTQEYIEQLQGRPNGKLVLVTAINPTPPAKARPRRPWAWATRSTASARRR